MVVDKYINIFLSNSYDKTLFIKLINEAEKKIKNDMI